MIMSNENQYLRPDYLTPLPSLDAKNSPLALLAQTCSQIGADAPTPSNGKVNTLDKGHPHHHHHHQHHHHKKALSSMSSSSSDHGGGGGRDKRSPSLSRSSSSSSCSNGGSPPGRALQAVHPHQPVAVAAVTTTARSSFKPYESCVVRPAAEVAAAAAAAAASAASAATATAISLDATIRRTTPMSAATGDRCSSKESASSRKSPLDDAATAGRKHGEQPHKPSPSSAASVAALMAAAGYPSPHHHHVQPPHPHHHHHMAAALGSSLMNPYFRPGAAAPPPSLACRDPYCAGCQLAVHMAASKQPQPSPVSAAPCPAGCTQCPDASPKTTAAANHHASAVAHHHHHHHQQQQQQHQQQQQQHHHHHTVASAYAHAQLAALAAAASQLPYVCSWMGTEMPSSYCGKRFGTSDELLQHLRTHTSDPAAALPLLQRSYPTPPLSPSAAAAANRYHPYASAGKHHSLYGFPSGYPSSPLALPPHPGLLPPYFPAVAYSPYAAAAAAAASPRIGTSPHT